MNEKIFKKVFGQFLENYWGAFHEVLEAQSVTPERLAGSLFNTLVAEHRAFEAAYPDDGRGAVKRLGQIWHELEAQRFIRPDPPLTHDQVTKARKLFEQVYDSLMRQGQRFPSARKEILRRAPHGTPKEPLRADATR